MSAKTPLTLEDLREFLAYVKAHEDDFDEFNVIQVQTVLGSFMHYIEAKAGDAD